MTCDFWECERIAECRSRFYDMNYPPCAFCCHFDCCDVCSNYLECADLVTRYLPNMFRRLVRDIRHGEDTTSTQQFIRRHTRGGKRD